MSESCAAQDDLLSARINYVLFLFIFFSFIMSFEKSVKQFKVIRINLLKCPIVVKSRRSLLRNQLGDIMHCLSQVGIKEIQ